MLAPKRVKFRKQQKGRTRGHATRGNTVAFGDYGLAEAHTTFGCIGVKVWIYKGDVLPAEKPAEEPAAVPETPSRRRAAPEAAKEPEQVRTGEEA